MPTSPPSYRRCSSSPSIAATLKPSRIACCLRAIYIAALGAVVVQVSRDGYPVLALACAAVAGVCVWPAVRQPRAVEYRGGRWLLPGRGWRAVSIEQVLSPPWGLALRWREGDAGRGHWLYLWPDSLPAAQWRRLRRALRLSV
ncbi:MAG: protein YgfX [Parahaliea sp.]